MDTKNETIIIIKVTAILSQYGFEIITEDFECTETSGFYYEVDGSGLAIVEEEKLGNLSDARMVTLEDESEEMSTFTYCLVKELEIYKKKTRAALVATAHSMKVTLDYMYAGIMNQLIRHVNN